VTDLMLDSADCCEDSEVYSAPKDSSLSPCNLVFYQI